MLILLILIWSARPAPFMQISRAANASRWLPGSVGVDGCHGIAERVAVPVSA
jgi:hypothetical protein